MTSPSPSGGGHARSQVEISAARTPEQLREHYEVERELADRLRHSRRDERARLYTEVYEELFRRVPHHPQLTQKSDVASQRLVVERQMRLLRRFLTPGCTFLELGGGDCSLSMEVAKQAGRVFAVEVSETIAAGDRPPNFELVLSDGVSVPVPEASVDVAYSNQLMEHLHPDDAQDQLRNIFRALRPGGCYVVITPNRLRGPNDISRFFDREATGFHLVEYSAGDLRRLFLQAGFRRLQAFAGGHGSYQRFPLPLLRMIEGTLELLPWKLRSALARRLPLKAILGVTLAGWR